MLTALNRAVRVSPIEEIEVVSEPGETWGRACGTEARPLFLGPECTCNGPGIVWAKGTTGRQEAGHGSVSAVLKNRAFALGNRVSTT